MCIRDSSYVYFGADGFGTDELRYADTGRYLDTLNIQWDAYDDTVPTEASRAFIQFCSTT